MDINETTERLLTHKKELEEYIYTPWQQAIEELDARRNNQEIEKYVASQLTHGIPEKMKDKKSMVLFRHLATPNYEVTRFFACADGLSTFGLEPLVLEYAEDKFNDRNQWKYFLGKLRFQKSVNAKGEAVFENLGVLNFNDSNNKPLSTIKTHWGQPLVDFHHELFVRKFPQFANCFTDLSEWLHHYGATGREYYKPFMSLFLQDAILFDNFRADEHELKFTREVILPAFLEVEKESGFKPLLVTLMPTEIEADNFWLSHPHTAKAFVDQKMVDKAT